MKVWERTYKAGRFEIQIFAPYPAWVKVFIDKEPHDYEGIFPSMTISQLRDLHYLIGNIIADTNGEDLG